MMELRVVLEPSDEGGYFACVPGLRGCISYGDTRVEALKNILQAVELCVASDTCQEPRSSKT